MHISYVIKFVVPVLNMIQQMPQLLKIIETKKVRDLSFYTIFIMLSTSTLWTAHGYFINDFTLFISSLVATVVNLLIFYLFLKYKNSNTNETISSTTKSNV